MMYEKKEEKNESTLRSVDCGGSAKMAGSCFWSVICVQIIIIYEAQRPAMYL